MPLPAIAAGALKVGAVLGKAAGATVKGVAAGAKTMGKAGAKAGKSAAKGTKSFGKSISKSTTKLKKSISNRTKSTKKIRKSMFDFAKKQKQRRDRRKAEANLEKSNQAKKKPDAQKGLKGGGNPLMKVINFLATIVIGWVVNNLPKIIDFIKNFIEKIKGFLEKFKEFFAGIGDFFKEIGGFITKAWDKITNLKMEDVTEGIKKALGNLKDGFTNLLSKLGEGLGLIKKKEKEDPEKLAKDGNFNSGTPKEVEGSPDTKKINSEVDKSGKDSSKSEQEFKGKLEELESIDFEKELSGESGDKDKSTATEKLIPDHGSTDKKKIDAGKVSPSKTKSKVSTGTDKKVKSKKKEQTLKFPEGAFEGKDSYTGPLVPVEEGKDGKSKLEVSKPQTQSTTSITPERKGQDVVILDQEAPPPVPSSPNSQSSSILILEENSLNNLMKQQFLTELAYT